VEAFPAGFIKLGVRFPPLAGLEPEPEIQDIP
jgi:hypothetical protein